jgi:hypothetical protein
VINLWKVSSNSGNVIAMGSKKYMYHLSPKNIILITVIKAEKKTYDRRAYFMSASG